MAEDLTKKFYFETPKNWNGILSQENFLDSKLEVKVIKHGIVLPALEIDNIFKGGVCDKDFNFVAGFTRKYSAEKSAGGGDSLLSNFLIALSVKKLFSWMKM